MTRRIGLFGVLALLVAMALFPGAAHALPGGTFSGTGPARLGPFEATTGVMVVEWDRDSDVAFAYQTSYGTYGGAGGVTGAQVLHVAGPTTWYINVTGSGSWWIDVSQPRPTTAPLGEWETGGAGRWVSEPFYLPPGTNVFDWQSCPSGTTAMLSPVAADTGRVPVSVYNTVTSQGRIYVLEVSSPGDWEVEIRTPETANVSVYRFYNLRNRSHFYTSSATERDTVIAQWPDVYRYEGIAYTINGMNSANSTPLLRFMNCDNQAHFYSMSYEERQLILVTWPQWWYEGPAFSVSKAYGIPVHRFYNRNSASHFYTTSAEECATVQQRWPQVFTYEGIGFYIAP